MPQIASQQAACLNLVFTTILLGVCLHQDALAQSSDDKAQPQHASYNPPGSPNDFADGRSLDQWQHSDPVRDTAFSNLIPRERKSHSHIEVPEPLLFDLVRPLGARKGELEFNVLAAFPWQSSNTNRDDDPFGPGPTTIDRRDIEWAPELEYAIADNFAIEFEFPFEGSVLEEYKLGLQWTIGTTFENHYIHGFQMLMEPTVDWENWNTTVLYIGGIRFDETWSGLFMLGGRVDLEGPNNFDSLEQLINGSIFADLNEKTTLGLETNYAAKLDGTAEFILVPQFHYELTQRLQVQSGLGLGAFSEGSEQSFILRVIGSR
ncbi:MAG: hypothetical protein MI861_15100 [Pirellulales bacterium]|nr:hypothetical protein [Pirellulales bacterium]